MLQFSKEMIAGARLFGRQATIWCQAAVAPVLPFSEKKQQLAELSLTRLLLTRLIYKRLGGRKGTRRGLIIIQDDSKQSAGRPTVRRAPISMEVTKRL